MTEFAVLSARGAARPGPWSTRPTAAPLPRLAYEPAGYGRLVTLHAVNTALTLLTLTVWRFWAVTHVRRVLWAHVRFDGEPLEYTGTGSEIFVGFLKVILLILLPIAVAVTVLQIALLDAAPQTAEVFDLIYVLGLLWFVALGKDLSLRYRASRTRWRGIRGRLAGTVGGYLWLTFWTSALTVTTLGLYKPWMDAKRIRYALQDARAGSLPVTCRITGGDLFWSWVITVLLAGVTFGLSFFWYRARLYRLVADRTDAGPLRFGFTASGGRHARLWLGNAALLFGPAIVAVLAFAPSVFSLVAAIGGAFDGSAANIDLGGLFGAGAVILAAVMLPYLLFTPFVWERRIRFVCRHLVVLGAIDLAAVRQAADDATTAGEGLAGDFDAL